MTSSGISMSASLVRPIARSCSSTGSASQAVEVVEVLLDDHVAAAGERRVLVADERRRLRRAALGVLGAVDEAEQVALVERAEAVHLVDDASVALEPLGQPLGELEAEIEPVRADVEQQVARGRDRGVALAGDLGERVQAGRARRPNRRSQSARRSRPRSSAPLRGSGSRPSACRPLTSARNSRMASSPPGSTVETRKIAASVSGSRMDWGSGVGIPDIVSDRPSGEGQAREGYGALRIDPPAMNAAPLHAEPQAPPLLAVDGLSVSFGSFRALSDVDLEIRRASWSPWRARTAPASRPSSAASPATSRPTSGRILLRGRARSPPTRAASRRRGVAVVWQDLALCDNLDVASNLLLGQEARACCAPRPGSTRPRRRCSTGSASPLRDTTRRSGRSRAASASCWRSRGRCSSGPSCSSSTSRRRRSA